MNSKTTIVKHDDRFVVKIKKVLLPLNRNTLLQILSKIPDSFVIKSVRQDNINEDIVFDFAEKDVKQDRVEDTTND